jgi:hypothetical protein
MDAVREREGDRHGHGGDEARGHGRSAVIDSTSDGKLVRLHPEERLGVLRVVADHMVLDLVGVDEP